MQTSTAFTIGNGTKMQYRFMFLAALVVTVLIGGKSGPVQVAHAESIQDPCLAATRYHRPDPRLGWLGQRVELDRLNICLETYFQMLNARPDELPGFSEGHVSLVRPLPTPLLTARFADNREQDTDASEAHAPLQSVEDEIDDGYVDPFEEKREPVDDPWESFNARTFAFNRSLDRYVFKPIATGYDWMVPDPVERAISRAFNNARVAPRVFNNLFQGKGEAAGIELSRFFVNSTVGIVGLFDVAHAGFGIASPEAEDTGKTLARYGIRSGPYLVLPFLPPTTVRDGIGMLGDLALNPLNLLVPFGPQLAARAGDTLNERSKNLDRFEGVEEGTLDLYAAVRDAYLQTRSNAIRE